MAKCQNGETTCYPGRGVKYRRRGSLLVCLVLAALSSLFSSRLGRIPTFKFWHGPEPESHAIVIRATTLGRIHLKVLSFDSAVKCIKLLESVLPANIYQHSKEFFFFFLFFNCLVYASFSPTGSKWQDFTTLLEHWNRDWGNKVPNRKEQNRKEIIRPAINTYQAFQDAIIPVFLNVDAYSSTLISTSCWLAVRNQSIVLVHFLDKNLTLYIRSTRLTSQKVCTRRDRHRTSLHLMSRTERLIYKCRLPVCTCRVWYHKLTSQSAQVWFLFHLT